MYECVLKMQRKVENIFRKWQYRLRSGKNAVDLIFTLKMNIERCGVEGNVLYPLLFILCMDGCLKQI